MRKIVQFAFYYILGIFGIAVISSAPALFQSEQLIDFSLYFQQLWELIKILFQPESWTYSYLEQELFIVPYLWEPFLYSIRMLVGGLFLGFIVAFFLAMLTISLPTSIQQVVRRVLGLMESVPDIMVAFFLQLSAVWVFQQTDILLIQFATLGDDRIYLAPIVTLSFLPMISMYRILMLLIQEEMTKPYVELARSKGLRTNVVLLKHVMRNITKSVFYQSKIIVWTSLSSLFVIEYIFNINGISSFILNDFRPIVIVFVLIMIFTPLFIIYQGAEIFIFKESFHSSTIRLKRKYQTRQQNRIALKQVLHMPTGSINGVKQFFYRLVSGFWQHLKNPKFTIGFVIIVGMVSVSFVHSMLNEEPVEQYVLVYDEAGELVSSKPHPPSDYVPMGSDYLGYSIKDQLLTGAKYTILFAVAVSLLRICLGFLFAVPYAFLITDKWRHWIGKFIDGFHYLPLTVISIVLLRVYLLGGATGFPQSLTERIIVQGLILTLLIVPLVSVLIGNEMRLILDREFIASANVLGANRKQILRKHVMPHLGAKLGIIFGQQFIQVLLLMIHLGLFELFLGGTSVMYDQFYHAPKHSVTFEWSGLISNAREAFMTEHYWIVMPVLIAFMIVIVAMQLMIEGIQEVQQHRVGVNNHRGRWWRRKNKTAETLPNRGQVSPEQFQRRDRL